MTENQIFSANLLTALTRNPGTTPDQVLDDVRKYLPSELTDINYDLTDNNGNRIGLDSKPLSENGITAYQYNRAFDAYFKVRKELK